MCMSIKNLFLLYKQCPIKFVFLPSGPWWWKKQLSIGTVASPLPSSMKVKSQLEHNSSGFFVVEESCKNASPLPPMHTLPPFMKRDPEKNQSRLWNDYFTVISEPAIVQAYSENSPNAAFCKKKLHTVSIHHGIKLGVQFWQGQRDSNSRHAVLETAALPNWAIPLNCSWWAIRDSNPGPTGYEPVALTNWANGP